MRLRHSDYPSPIGVLGLIFSDDGVLYALDFEGFEDRRTALLRRYQGPVTPARGPLPRTLGRALDDYFAGDLGALATIPVAVQGTAFQQRVWAGLRAIPAGATRSYGALAAAIGAPRAVRAVGAANGANPVAIAVPCHRVIGADGSLTGFGGGLDRKRWLLAHEGVRIAFE